MKTVDFKKLSQPVTLKLVGADIEGQCHFLTLAQGRVHTKIQLLCSSKPNFV